MKSGTGLAFVAGSTLWFDLLLAGKTPANSLSVFEERFGVTQQDMKKLLTLAKSKGGEFSELFFQYQRSQ